MDIPTSLDEFKLWKVDRLKSFLKERKLKVSGRKDELVALAFAAVQLGISAQGADEREIKSRDYVSLLKVGEDILPDPLKDLTNGWEGEGSMKKWPPCMYFDIANFLTNLDDVELGKRLMKDYKDGKSYSYLESGWMGEVFYHGLDANSKYCFLRADCRPSQRLNNIPWRTWVCLEKTSGKVVNAYCTCFAGLGSVCNHVGALLFKVDLAWRTGITQQSVTEAHCSWNRYGATKVVEPRPISEMDWSKPHFTKYGQQTPINPPESQLFNPGYRQKTTTTLDSLTNVLMPVCPNACFLQCTADPEVTEPYKPESDLNVSNFEDVLTSPSIPPSIADLAKCYASPELFVASLPCYTSEQVQQIELETRGQAENPMWLAQRKGRLAASKIHAVVTRVRTIRSSDSEVDTSGLVKTISGVSGPSPDLPALKYVELWKDRLERPMLT